MECLNEEERQMRKHPNHGYKLMREGKTMDDESCDPFENNTKLIKWCLYIAITVIASSIVASCIFEF